MTPDEYFIELKAEGNEESGYILMNLLTSNVGDNAFMTCQRFSSIKRLLRVTALVFKYLLRSLKDEDEEK